MILWKSQNYKGRELWLLESRDEGDIITDITGSIMADRTAPHADRNGYCTNLHVLKLLEQYTSPPKKPISLYVNLKIKLKEASDSSQETKYQERTFI